MHFCGMESHISEFQFFRSHAVFLCRIKATPEDDGVFAILGRRMD